MTRPGACYRILLVEDDPLFIDILEAYALRMDVVLVVCHCAEELHTITDWHFDAALIDYDLPSLDGVRVSQFIKALVGPIPTFITSGHSKIRKCCPDTVLGFLPKQDGAEAVLSRVVSACSKTR